MHYLLQQSTDLVSSSAVMFTSSVHPERDDSLLLKGPASSLLRVIAGLLNDNHLKTITITPRFKPTSFLRNSKQNNLTLTEGKENGSNKRTLTMIGRERMAG